MNSGTSKILFVPKGGFTDGPVAMRDVLTRVGVSGACWGVRRPSIERSGRQISFLRIPDGKVTHHIDFVDYADAVRRTEGLR